VAARDQVRRVSDARPARSGAVRLLTRTGLDWTHKYPAIASAVAWLPAGQAYLDGELCGVRPDGTTSFSLIQNACSGRDARGGPECSSNLSKRICRTPCSTSVRPIPRPPFERSKTGQITRYKNRTDHESPTGDELQACQPVSAPSCFRRVCRQQQRCGCDAYRLRSGASCRAAVELRRLLPGIANSDQARALARTNRRLEDASVTSRWKMTGNPHG
jgi:hypothetical protein